MGFWDWDFEDDERAEWERVLRGLRDGAFFGDEEGVIRRGLVSVNTGWLARGGLLRLRDSGLEFTPNPLERLLGARVRRFGFTEMVRVERRPRREWMVLPGGQLPRITLHMRGGEAVDVLPAGDTLERWLALITNQMEVWERRRRFVEYEQEMAA